MESLGFLSVFKACLRILRKSISDSLLKAITALR
jgi:hypothetical protein